jgi:lysine biosynthesis protein LysW
MQLEEKMPTAICPECDADVKIDINPRKGMQVTCRSCGTFLEVINISPIELDWIFDDADDIDYDLDDDDDDYDDDDFDY